MIDIHHHLLPGLDDGSRSLEMSVDMARLAATEGITHIVCTPHANTQYTFDPSRNAALLEELRARLAQEKIPVTLGQGCDFHVTYDNVREARADPGRFSINGMGYLLVEIPDYALPPGLSETFYELRLSSMTPVLTHPERNPTLVKDYARLREWLRGGLLVQVTADSLTGHKGKSAQHMAIDLLDRRWVHFLATDAHNPKSRPPRMRAAYELVAQRYGEGYAHALCVSYPLAAFHGHPIEVEDEPLDLFDDPAPPSLWDRLTRRFQAE
jgi:protein-tyrosine phosphatase